MKNERMNILKQDHKEANFFGKPLVRYGIMLATTFADIRLMYMLLTDILTQDAFSLWTATILMGAMLALFPVFIAIECHKLYYKITKQTIVFIILLCVFTVFVAFTAWVRISTRELEFATSASTFAGFGETANVSLTAQDKENPYAMATACLLSFLPVLFAAINFAIGWNFENPITRRIKKAETTAALLNEKIVQNEALCAAYSADHDYKARMLAEENEKYETAIGKIDAMKEYYKSYVRERIAEHLGDPGATSELADTRNFAAENVITEVKSIETQIENEDEEEAA